MFYTTLWCDSTEENFTRSVPLHFLGKSLLQHKSKYVFNLVFLEGLELLSDSYIESLKQYGFGIIDYSKHYPQLIKKYDAINKFYGTYERNCYLRWLALKDILLDRGDKSEQFWHLDSDIILHTSLDELASDTSGKTFMLQGCPVLLSVSDMGWFTVYESELQKLNADITGYAQKAALVKNTNRVNDLKLCNESVYANPFTHDQDLIEYLVASKKIIQDNALTVFASRFYYIQNALSLHKWHAVQCNPEDKFRYDGNNIIIGSKAVPFIHYQNTFVAYANVYIFLQKLRLPVFIRKKVLKFEIKDENFKTSFYFKLISKFLKFTALSKSREQVIGELADPKSNTNIVTLLNFIKKQVG